MDAGGCEEVDAKEWMEAHMERVVETWSEVEPASTVVEDVECVTLLG